MSRRTDRVADAIRETLAELLLREVKDPRIGMITITAVNVSPDLHRARVFFSVLGDAAQRDRALAGLRSAAGFLRGELTHRLRLRVAPDLLFEFDPSLEQAARVARLLKDALPDESES
jgi:ribosome-binding factor A